MLKKLFYRISGGRPMKREFALFADVVSGKRVNLYTDAFGKKWMANAGLNIFRVRYRKGNEDEKA